jgi:hypothetical protein
MTQPGSPLILSRRKLFALAGAGIAACAPLSASSGEFWEKKTPNEWTPEEIDKLVTKSPWAKEVTAQYAPGEGGGGYPNGGGNGGGYPNDGGYPGNGGGGYPGGGGGGYPNGGGGYPGGGMGGPRIGLGIPGIGGIGGGGMGGGRRRGQQGGQGRGNASSYKGIVRWESAKPILEATKSTLPETFANHYVIAVSGIPLLTPRSRRTQTEDDDDRSSTRQSGDSQDNFDELKQLTTLQPKGKDLAQAGIVQRQVSNGSVLLFGFSKESLSLTPADKEVDFSTRLGSLIVKAKFNMKEMDYRGQLAV